MLQKAYSLVTVKGFDPQKRTFSGIATSPVPDRIGDTIDSKGIHYKNPLPLLLYHNSQKPVGEAKFSKPTADGTPFDARISKIDRPGIVKDRLDEAVDSLSADPPLIRGVSIGFMPLASPIYSKETGGYHYPSVEVHELSMVVIPMHQDATIDLVKSLDNAGSAAKKDMSSMLAACRDCRAALAACLTACRAFLNDPAIAKAVAACVEACETCESACADCLSADPGAAMAAACAACAEACQTCRKACLACADACGETAKYAACAEACRTCAASCASCRTECLAMADMPSMRAASGRSRNSAGVSAPTRTVKLRPERPMKNSYADQIVNFQNTRAAKVAKLDAILEKSVETGETLDDAQKEAHDTLAAEIKEIDEHLDRLAAAEAREKAAAVQVKGTTSTTGAESRGTTRISVEKKLPPGIQFARYAMCVALARGNEYEAKQIARDNYGDDAHGLIKLIELTQKGAVGALNAQTAGSGSELVPYNIMDDFIEYLRPRTILGKFGTNGIPSLRRVPFNTRVSGFSAGLSAAWVGEGLPVLLSKPTSITATLGWAKIAALTVLTKEEIRFSNPGAEAKVRDDISAAVVEKQDKDFIDPAKAAVANVSPASVTWNTTPVLTTGTTATALRTDLATLLATFATAKLSPSSIVLIMSTVDALNLSLMITSLGNPVFPGLTMAGGNLLGIPVITTEATVSIGSPVSSIIVAVAASEVYFADDGVVTVDASDQASIEMVDSSSQSGLTGTGASQVSMFQTNMLALKATREINWLKRRSTAARYIYNAAYRA